MKKLVLFIAIIAFLSTALPSSAMDISIGATSWYANWSFTPNGGEKIDPGLLYGPALAVKLNDDFGVNSVFLLGDFKTNQAFTYHRYDSDTSLSYRLNNYLKIFGGFKYMDYDYSNQPGNNSSIYSIGPAAGISGVLPMVNDFFILANVSGMYLWTTENETITGSPSSSAKIKTWGANATVSLAYYIEPAAVTLSLGGRYQYIDYYNVSPASKHSIYGVTASATYTFSI